MRGFWRVLAHLGEDKNGFCNDLGKLSAFVSDPDLLDSIKLTGNSNDPRVLSLKNQPAKPTLDGIDEFLRTKHNMTLFLYELAEVNRIVSETKGQNPSHKTLKAYWKGLGQVAPDNSGSIGFMEAVGALSVDKWVRRSFATDPKLSLAKWFDVTPDQQTKLRAALQPSSPSEIAAEEYFRDSWPGGSCESVVTSQDKWFHVNV